MIFPVASVSRPALGPTQPPVQWVPGVLSPGLKRGRVVTLTTHPHLVPRSRMSRSYTPLPPSAYINPVHTLSSCIFKLHFNIVLHLRLPSKLSLRLFHGHPTLRVYMLIHEKFYTKLLDLEPRYAWYQLFASHNVTHRTSWSNG
jgi:hypothetical protein